MILVSEIYKIEWFVLKYSYFEIEIFIKMCHILAKLIQTGVKHSILNFINLCGITELPQQWKKCLFVKRIIKQCSKCL
jgi:hypothetical protein